MIRQISTKIVNTNTQANFTFCKILTVKKYGRKIKTITNLRAGVLFTGVKTQNSDVVTRETHTKNVSLTHGEISMWVRQSSHANYFLVTPLHSPFRTWPVSFSPKNNQNKKLKHVNQVP